MRIFISLLKASVVAAAVFALAWIRVPQLVSSLETVVRIFIAYGVLIVILSLVIGFPVAIIAERHRLVRWWVASTAGAAAGALLGGILTYRPSLGPDEIENPFALTFSPWNRDSPGFADNVPLSSIDGWGSIAFGAIVGAVLGIAFWYFYRRGARLVT